MPRVNITVLSSDHPAVSVTPGNCTATREIFVGLVMHFHYVGLPRCVILVLKRRLHRMPKPFQKQMAMLL